MRLALFAFLLVILPFQADADSCKRLSVYVSNAKGLERKAGGAPNAYVEVEVGGYTKKTDITIEEANPSFRQSFRFWRVSSDVMTLKIKDMGSCADELLGSCQIKLESTPRGKQMNRGRGSSVFCATGNGGKVFYSFQCY